MLPKLRGSCLVAGSAPGFAAPERPVAYRIAANGGIGRFAAVDAHVVHQQMLEARTEQRQQTFDQLRDRETGLLVVLGRFNAASAHKLLAAHYEWKNAIALTSEAQTAVIEEVCGPWPDKPRGGLGFSTGLMAAMIGLSIGQSVVVTGFSFIDHGYFYAPRAASGHGPCDAEALERMVERHALRLTTTSRELHQRFGMALED